MRDYGSRHAPLAGGPGGRVAGVPEELRGVSRALHATAGDLEHLATQIGGLSYPEMPPATAGTVRALVGNAASRIRRGAIVAETAGGDVRRRAL